MMGLRNGDTSASTGYYSIAVSSYYDNGIKLINPFSESEQSVTVSNGYVSLPMNPWTYNVWVPSGLLSAWDPNVRCRLCTADAPLRYAVSRTV